MMLESTYDEVWPVRIVGCGECGSHIASVLSLKPSFVPVMRDEFFPVRATAFDTDEGINADLTENWGWRPDQQVNVLPGVRGEDARAFLRRLLDQGTSDRISQQSLGRAPGYFLENRGIGGQPVLGRLAATAVLENDSAGLGPTIAEGLQSRGFAGGILLTVNSLTGGTGSGFAAPVLRFMASDVMPGTIRSVLNVSVIPAEHEFDAIYPRSILAALHGLLSSELPDGIILVDNGTMAHNFGCRNFRDYNLTIQEMLTPVLLAPQPRYQVPEFGSSLDGADMKNWIRKYQGFGSPDLCAIGFARSRPPGRFQNKEAFLQSLVEQACKQTTVECDPQRSLGAVAVLAGPPAFFRKSLRHNDKYYSHTAAVLRKHVCSRLKLACVQFEELDDVRLSIVMSGITTEKIMRICRMAVANPRWGEIETGTVGDRIRGLDENYVLRLAMREALEYVEQEPTP